MSFDFLFAQPSFTRGLARAADFWGTSDVYNISKSPNDADALAMWADWKDVGTELLRAASSVSEEIAEEPLRRAG
ncbi:MAG TPA: hypothetical protein VGS96_03270 [Thermoanaerobaculia bacterium]|jgi:hypothetical protein|nr:hypothetical protein [Thermoanaerobaculia bacterium]